MILHFVAQIIPVAALVMLPCSVLNVSQFILIWSLVTVINCSLQWQLAAINRPEIMKAGLKVLQHRSYLLLLWFCHHVGYQCKLVNLATVVSYSHKLFITAAVMILHFLAQIIKQIIPIAALVMVPCCVLNVSQFILIWS